MITKTLKIIDLAVEAGISCSGIPFSDKIYSLAKIGASSVYDYINQRNEKSCYEFHRRLLSEPADKSDNPLTEAVIETADYHALLSACLADIEEEKSRIYGTLAQSVAMQKVNTDTKRFFITKLKETTWSQLDLLAKVYVVSAHRIMPPEKHYDVSTGDILKIQDPYSAMGLDAHFLHESQFLKNNQITTLGKRFIEACFPKELLEPSAFGFQQWQDTTCALFMLGNHNELAYNLGPTIQNYFRKNRILTILLAEAEFDRLPRIPHVSIRMICYDNGAQLDPLRLQNLETMSRLCRTEQVIFSPNDDDIIRPVTQSVPHTVILHRDLSKAGEILTKKISEILNEAQ